MVASALLRAAFALGLALPTAPAPDTSSIRGTVRESGTVGVPGANVFLLQTLEGAVTDGAGGFEFTTHLEGNATLIVRRDGYLELRTAVTLPTGALDIVVDREPIRLAPIVVEPGRYGGGAEGEVSLTSLDVVTTPGAAADVFRAIQTFPGLQTVTDGAGLFVRGGDVSETRITLDGAVVLAPYRFESPTGNAFGAFDPFSLDGIYFSAGGFGVRHGDALSGLAELQTRGRPTTNQLDVSASLAALSARAGAALPHGLGVRVGGTRSSTRLLFDLNGVDEDFSQVPEGRDVNAALTWEYSPEGRMKLFTVRQWDQFGVAVESPSFNGGFDAENRTDLTVLSGTDLLGSAVVSYSASVSGRTREQAFGAFRLREQDRYFQARGELGVTLGPSWFGRAGIEWERREAGLAGSIPDEGHDVRPGARTTVFDSELSGGRTGVFVEGEWTARLWLRVKGGVRTDLAELTSRRTYGPRVSAAVSLMDGAALTFAWGRYHQVPNPLFFEPTVGIPGLEAMRAEHRVAALQIGSGARQIRAEIYRKDYRDLSANTRDNQVNPGGRGLSRGIDLYAAGAGPFGTTGRFAFSAIQAERTDPDTGLLARSPWDIRRNVVAVIERNWNSRFTTGVTYKRATGRPFTPVVGATLDFDQDIWVPEFGEPFSERLPTYARLDLSASLLLGLGRDDLTVLFASISNLLGRDNISAYQYNDDYSERIPTGQGFSRTLYFGVSSTLSF